VKYESEQEYGKPVGRGHSYEQRLLLQQKKTPLPFFPVTTIGSFPHTYIARKARRLLSDGVLRPLQYVDFLKEEIRRAVQLQEKSGVDVLSTGEFERNDEAEYMADCLDGMIASAHGWVQSFGSRCVRPPIVYGDIERTEPFSHEIFRYAQSLTKKPVKATLLGPFTLLGWSFLREDSSFDRLLQQAALVVKDEIRDLEAAGCSFVQIDEPAIHERVPFSKEQHSYLLDRFAQLYRFMLSDVRDTTRVYVHMCHSPWEEYLSALEQCDIDGVFVDASRRDGFAKQAKPPTFQRALGLGVYDVHSSIPPDEEQIAARLHQHRKQFAKEQLWIVPDCGLKNHTWSEVEQLLQALVQAARRFRSS
jgi:5-methyltetrahydropteroyltriglutamate--homocysteine methyltransferase